MMKNSLSKEKEIVAILRKKPFFSRNLMIRVAKQISNTDYRYTIIVSKKIFKEATKRNRIKRRIRAIITSVKLQIDKKIDFVIIPKKIVLDMPFLDLKKELIELLSRSRVI